MISVLVRIPGVGSTVQQYTDTPKRGDTLYCVSRHVNGSGIVVSRELHPHTHENLACCIVELDGWIDEKAES